MTGFLSRLVTKICHVLTTRMTTVEDDEVVPRRNAGRTFKVPDQYLLTTRTIDNEDAPAVPNFQGITYSVLIQHNTITRARAFE
ncbi:hypothetical protein Tco_1414265, partial [Tanacetum coccineum]